MSLSTIEVEKAKKYFNDPRKGLKALTHPSAQTKQKASHLSGKALARRLKGMLTQEEAVIFERHINESCEQEND